MNEKAEKFRESLRIDTKENKFNEANRNIKAPKIQTIYFIDDDSSVKDDVQARLGSVQCEIITIDDLVHYCNIKKSGLFQEADKIFIDAFYSDEETKRYAIDFFDMYREINVETKNETENKYKVLLAIDHINERLNSKNEHMAAREENYRVRALNEKIKKHPHLKWGIRQGDKIDIIIKEIEKYMEKTDECR